MQSSIRTLNLPEILNSEETQDLIEILNSEETQDRTEIPNSEEIQDRTEILNSVEIQDRTEIPNSEETQDRTEILNSEETQDRTEILNSVETQDRTEILNSKKDGKFEKSYNSDRPYKKFDGKGKDFGNKRSDRSYDGKSDRDFRKDNNRKPKQERSFEPEDDGLIRLNRYISNSGICSRRKADELIEAGVISVNGVVVTELGTKVDPAKDEIRYNDERLKREKMVYVLLNKPKDYITTTDDPQERKTVMQLVSKATKERIYPVGRLDRNTTGLLLLTNDGNLAEKLSHPRKQYQQNLPSRIEQKLNARRFQQNPIWC
uniref:pseudouridine synthase n=1 Tax=Sphingobacterium daejeonense TaxID=371142 RepID=UPI0037448090